jgi:hypothetical protein
MTAPLTPDQVSAIAPDPAAATAARAIGTPRKWQSIGRSPRALWGEFRGSALYRTRIATADLAAECTCPSRKRPCKHTLGLLYAAADAPIAELPEPGWVKDWLDRHATAAATREKRASTRAAAAADPEARARRVQKRQENVLAGLDGLEAWLDDVVRQGVARLEGESPAMWEGLARRLVDAQATGLASRVRRLAELVGARPTWPEELTEQLGLLALLLHAYRRMDALPEPLQHDVRQLVGHTMDSAEVLARGDVVADTWHVLGSTTSDDGRLRSQRAWLRGEASGRSAMILQFAAGGARFAETIVPGTRIDGALAFWPGAWPRRALVQRRDGEASGVTLSPRVSVRGLLAAHAEALAQQPWLESQLAVLADVVPMPVGEGMLAVDGEDGAIVVAAREPERLLAISGGRPVDLVGEWDGRRLWPLALGAEGRFHALGATPDG